MSLKSIFFPSAEQKAENAASMLQGIFNEWRLILGMLVGSIVLPMVMGSPPEETIIFFAFTLVFFMPSALAVVLVIKYLRNAF